MRVLTLREPWASLIAYGPKRIETRSWHSSYWGPLYIHAGAAGIDKKDPHIRALMELLPGREPSYGLVLCRCTLTDCLPMDEAFLSGLTDPVERLCGQYGPGRWAWVLKDVEALDAPFPAKGKLGIWTLNRPASV